MRVNVQLLSGTALSTVAAALSGPATAADMVLKAKPPVAASTWAGFYLGGHLGGAIAKFEGFSNSGFADGRSTSPAGLIGGFHGGYNWQAGQWVFGIEGNYTWARFVDGKVLVGGPGTGLIGELRSLASIRGRLGWVFDRTLLYATAGWGWARYSAGANDSGIVTFRNTASAPVVGLGAEWKVFQQWSVRVEALHYFFNRTLPSAGSEPAAYTIKPATTFTVGASYHF